MPSAVSPDYFVAKKGAGQVKGRAVWIDGRGVKKHPLLKRTAGKCAEPIFCQENFILFFFTNKKREMAHFALQFAQFLFVVLLTFFLLFLLLFNFNLQLFF